MTSSPELDLHPCAVKAVITVCEYGYLNSQIDKSQRKLDNSFKRLKSLHFLPSFMYPSLDRKNRPEAEMKRCREDIKPGNLS